MKTNELAIGDTIAARFIGGACEFDVCAVTDGLVMVRCGEIRAIWDDQDLRERRAIKLTQALPALRGMTKPGHFRRIVRSVVRIIYRDLDDQCPASQNR